MDIVRPITLLVVEAQIQLLVHMHIVKIILLVIKTVNIQLKNHLELLYVLENFQHHHYFQYLVL